MGLKEIMVRHGDKRMLVEIAYHSMAGFWKLWPMRTLIGLHW
jgi:hypothetical protein